MLSTHQNNSRAATFRGRGKEQMRGQRQAGRARTGKGKHAGDAGQIKEFGLYAVGNGEPMKALNRLSQDVSIFK